MLLGGAVQRRERDRMATGEVPMTKLKAALAVAVLTCIWAGANAVGKRAGMRETTTSH